MELVVIAAVAANGVIGANGDIPWHYPADLAHFKETTMGHPVIMGRVTFESVFNRLGGPLPGRTNIVLTRSAIELPTDVIRATSLDAALAEAERIDNVAFVMGGATVYEAILPRANRLVLTELHDAYEGDTWFPELAPNNWREVDRDARDDFDIVAYERVA